MDEQEIRETHTTWIDAVNAGNLDLLLTMLADDVVLLSPGQPPADREKFRENFSAAKQQILFHCVSDLVEVIVSGDIACARSHDTLEVTPRAGGETSRFAGDRLTIYRRQPDGRWLLSRDAHTLSPVKA